MDNSDSRLDRRSLLRRAGGGLALVVLAPLGAAVTGCGKKALVCTDTAGLTAAEAQMRTTLQYVDRAADATRACTRCRFYQPAAADSCGRCTLVKGPIHPDGSCTGFNART